MPIRVDCKCGNRFNIVEAWAVKSIRCPQCNQIVQVSDPNRGAKSNRPVKATSRNPIATAPDAESGFPSRIVSPFRFVRWIRRIGLAIIVLASLSAAFFFIRSFRTEQASHPAEQASQPAEEQIHGEEQLHETESTVPSEAHTAPSAVEQLQLGSRYRNMLDMVETLGGTIRVCGDPTENPRLFVYLAGSDITDDQLATFSDLQLVTWLDLERTGVTDDGLQHLKKLKYLTGLHLGRNTRVTRSMMVQLESMFPYGNVYPNPEVALSGPNAPLVIADSNPTPEETHLLELVNAFRKNPKATGEQIAREQADYRAIRYFKVDIEMFREELSEMKSTPPLVWNKRLARAAREHAHYLRLNGGAHDEFVGKPGFCGRHPMQRVQRTKYEALRSGECVGPQCPNVKDIFLGYIVDWGEGPGGMQPERGHRGILASSEMREIGIGQLPHLTTNEKLRSQFVNVIEVAERGYVPRFAGGVVYIDHNHNSLYDPGEGLGGIEIRSSDGSKTKTWPSGAFTLELLTTGPVNLQVSYGSHQHRQPFLAGADNIEFSWRLLPETLNPTK